MSCDAHLDRRHIDGGPPPETARPITVAEFVRTPFAVRCNVVKAWRPLPPNLWTALSQSQDQRRARQVERRAVLGVTIVALVLVAGISGAGKCMADGDDLRCYPLLGRSTDIPQAGTRAPGWYYAAGQSLELALWVVGPSLCGWAFVRVIWIPSAAANQECRRSAATLAGHLASVYLYVYLMIAVGAALLVLLVALAPQSTETFRWVLWCFLFGESFFVPAVMWLRLVHHESARQAFGQFRHAVLGLYLILFVVIPIAEMVRGFT